MRIARHGEEGASHAVTYYAVVDTAAQKLAWLSLKHGDRRTHQLRAHMEHIGLRSSATRNISASRTMSFTAACRTSCTFWRGGLRPHPRGGVIDVTAPLPPHMQQTWTFNLLGLAPSATIRS